MLIYVYLLFVFGISASIININYSKNFNAQNFNLSTESFEKQNKKIIVIVSALLLIFVSSFRDFSVGVDTSNYYQHFYALKLGGKNYNQFEPIFEFINFLAVKINLPFSYVLFICSAIIISAFSYIIYKYSNNVSFSFFLLVALGIYGNTFNAIRQYLALAMFLYSLKYIIDGKFLPYLACCILAYGFHSSAILFVLIYFIRYFEMNKKFIFFSVIALVIFGFCLNPVVKLISMFTKIDYYNRYLTNPEFIEPISLYNVFYSIGMFFVFVVFYYFKRYADKLSDKQKLIYNLLLILFYFSICIRFYGTFSGLFSLVNRFTIYFFFPIIFLFPYAIGFIKERFRIIIMPVIMLLGIIYNLISGVIRGSNGIYPYNFVFDNIYLLVFSDIFLIICCVIIVFATLKIYGKKETIL